MLKEIQAFIRGVWEFRLCATWADPERDENGWPTQADMAYDLGRETAHRLTFRYFEEV